MSARLLLGLFDSVYVIALTAWVGGILFFSFAMVPLIVRVLGSEGADRFRRAMYPRYYAWGAASGAIALPAYVAVPLCFPEYRGPWVGVQALVILGGTLLMLYAGNSLAPAMSAARGSGPEGRDRSERLRRRSVALNGLVLLAGLGLLIAFANRPAPRTAGIRELSPADQARYNAELGQVIERVEARYGYRPDGSKSTAPKAASDSVVEPEMVRELESYYARKKARDQQRTPSSSDGPGH